MREEASKPVNFRVSPELSKRLEAEAEKAGMSRGEYARRLLIECLDDTERERVRHDIAELREEVVKLREDLATAVMALLVRGEPYSVEEAKAWVIRRLLPPPDLH